MREEINAKLNAILTKYDLTVEGYRRRSADVFADEAAVKRYLDEHPDMKERYQALAAGSNGTRRRAPVLGTHLYELPSAFHPEPSREPAARPAP